MENREFSAGSGEKAMPRKRSPGMRFSFLMGVMTLHGDISLDRPLLVVALEEEAFYLHVSALPVLVTGVGKVSAASSLAAVLSRQRPSRIINLGTAGALREGLTGTHVVGRVMQHDFDDETVFALTGAHFGEPIDLGPGPVLASGDVFVSGGEARQRLAAQAELVDMEGYAIARVARDFGLPATLVKDVSDEAGAEAGRTWRAALDACAERLGDWVRREVLAA